MLLRVDLWIAAEQVIFIAGMLSDCTFTPTNLALVFGLRERSSWFDVVIGCKQTDTRARYRLEYIYL